MAKDDRLVALQLNGPDEVRAGEQFDVTLTIQNSATTVEDGDVDLCSNSQVCEGGDAWCIQPYVVSPVDGTLKGSGDCVPMAEEGSLVEKDYTFTLTAPDKRSNDLTHTAYGGFVLPGSVGNVDIQSHEVTHEFDVIARTSAGDNTGPNSVNIARKELLQGGFRFSGSAKDDKEVTGYTWEIGYGSNHEEHYDCGTYGWDDCWRTVYNRTLVQTAGSSNAVVRMPYGGQASKFRDYTIVKLTAHDSSGNMSSTGWERFNTTSTEAEGLLYKTSLDPNFRSDVGNVDTGSGSDPSNGGGNGDGGLGNLPIDISTRRGAIIAGSALLAGGMVVSGAFEG